MDALSRLIMENFVEKAAPWILPAMFLLFAYGVTLRFLIWYTARAEFHFAREFQKRVQNHLSGEGNEQVRISSFYLLCQTILQKTYYEVFELRKKYRRRNLDYVTSFADRAFLIDESANRLVQDTLDRARYLRKDGHHHPEMMDISRGVFESNPGFNKILGIFPAGLTNDFVNLLPGLFVIGGIFGTFLGIAKGIPELGGMDMSHIEESKKILDAFLNTIALAMIKSIVGIGLSVVMTVINTLLSPDSLYYQVINRYSDSLNRLWAESTTNEIPSTSVVKDEPEVIKNYLDTDAA